MASYSKQLLSASTAGEPITISATATPGTTIHVAVSGTTGFDEMYVWASNVTATTATLTVEWGGVTDPGDHLVKQYSIPAYSLPIPIALGQVVQNGVTIAGFSGTASAINVTGFVNRIQ